MNRIVFAGLALVLVRDCSLAGPRFHGPIQGTWGGQNAGLMAFDTTAHVHIGCTAGDTKQAIVADPQGQFDVPGRYNITLYPVARGPDLPAAGAGSQLDMRARPQTLALFLGAVALPAGLQAQERPVSVATGAGLVF